MLNENQFFLTSGCSFRHGKGFWALNSPSDRHDGALVVPTDITSRQWIINMRAVRLLWMAQVWQSCCWMLYRQWSFANSKSLFCCVSMTKSDIDDFSLFTNFLWMLEALEEWVRLHNSPHLQLFWSLKWRAFPIFPICAHKTGILRSENPLREL